MQLAHRWGDRNLTRMELVMAILVMAILIGTFSRHTLMIFGKVEKTLIEKTVLDLDTVLNYRASMAVLNHDINTLNELLIMNPMDLMVKSEVADLQFLDNEENEILIPVDKIMPAPSSYSGVVFDDSDPLLESGRWFFDQDDNILFYILDNKEYFVSNIDGPARVRYKVRLQYTDENKNGLFDLLTDQFISLKLQAIDNFEWSF
jgi:hypothetical protein